MMAKIDTAPNVVYRGQIIRVQVPHYCRSFVKNASGQQSSASSQVTTAAEELERRRCLLEARNRYHSEPDLLDAVAASLDDHQSTSHGPRLSTEPHTKVADEYVPRTVVLRKNGGTFGFLLCGTTSHTGSMQGVFRPTIDHPASQYFDSVQRGSVAANAGLKTGDFLLEINGENVATATHGRTVQLIRNSGDAICLKIVTPPRRAVDRPRQLERVAARCPQEARRSTTGNSGGPSHRHRAQRAANKTTSSRVAPPRTAVGHLPSAHLTTARSMPDLTAAADNHNASDHPRRHQNNHDATAAANDEVRTSSVADYRDRVLYELTNRLRPSPVVRQRPALGGSSSARPRDSESTTSESRPGTKSADESAGPQRRPPPPPRGMSLSSRLQAPAGPAAASSLTAPTANTTGSELKQLLGGHAATSSQTAGRVQQSPTSSPSTEARSTISGEHLVLPSQLKKLQRSPTSNIQAAKQSEEDDSETGMRPTSSGDAATKLNGHTHSEHRLPAPKRPAPPPPRLTTPPATNGEINFLVMAEEARKQYILSKLAVGTLAAYKTADNSVAVPANEKQTADTKRVNDHELQKAVNGLTICFETNGGSHLIANDKSKSPTSSELLTETAWSLQAHQTVEQTVNHSPPLRSTHQPSTETSPTGPPPVIPPKRRPRNSSRAAVYNNETSSFEGRMTSNVSDNGTNGVPQSHVSKNEFSGTKLSENAANILREIPHAEVSNEHERKSTAKLTRGKNVVIRRSGHSRLSPDDMTATNGEYASTSDDKLRDDAERVQQLMLSVCDVGVLPPPPDFAD